MKYLKSNLRWLIRYWLVAIVLVVGARTLGQFSAGWVLVTEDGWYKPVVIDLTTQVSHRLTLQSNAESFPVAVSPGCGIAYFTREREPGQHLLNIRQPDGTEHVVIPPDDYLDPSRLQWYHHEGYIVFYGMHGSDQTIVSPDGRDIRLVGGGNYYSEDFQEMFLINHFVAEDGAELSQLRHLNILTGEETIIQTPYFHNAAPWYWWAGDTSAYGGDLRGIVEYEFATATEKITPLPETTAFAWIAAFSPARDSLILAQSTYDENDRSRKTEDYRYLVRLPAMEFIPLSGGNFGNAAYDHQGDRIAAVTDTRTIQIWRTSDVEPLDTIQPPPDETVENVRIEAWSPDDRYLMHTGDTQARYVYDTQTRKLHSWYTENYGGDWMPDSSTLYYRTGGQTVFIDFQTGLPRIAGRYNDGGMSWLCQWDRS